MSNKEIAEQIAKGHCVDYHKGMKFDDCSFDECMASALEMAELKDQKFKEILERLQDRFVGYDKHNDWLAIQKIINEL